MKNILLASMIIVSSIAATSARASGTYDVKGAGIYSCGTWTKDRGQGSDSVVASVDEQWLLGFIVGQEYLISANRRKNYTISTDSNGIFAWIDNYCQENPTRQIVDAALAFVENSGSVAPAN